mgnify:CR=1 FL=1
MNKNPRFRETEAWITLKNISRPNIYAIRDMRWFEREINKYHIKGMVDPMSRAASQRPEEFVGPNHLIFGMECAAVMKVRYIANATAERNVMTASQMMTKLAWDRIGKVSGDLFKAGEVMRVPIRRR